MKIVTLVENTVDVDKDCLKPQHGLSLYVETGDRKFLFDTGQDRLFLENASKMNVDPGAVDFLIISHAHYDHGGGLSQFLQNNAKAKVVLSKYCWGNYHAKILPGIYKHIGLNRELPASYKERFCYVEDGLRLAENMFILTNSHKSGFIPGGNKRLYTKENNKYLKDDFRHELIFAVDEPDGTVIFTGCSHSGIANMLKSYRTIFPGGKIKALIGGFHLMNPLTKKMHEDRDSVLRLAAEIREFNIDKIYTGHCTGKEAFDVLSQRLEGIIHEFKTGKEIIV